MKKIALAAAVAALAGTAQAASISGSMDLKVTMPEILVLYHFDEVEIDLTVAAATDANDSDEYEVSETNTTDVTFELDGNAKTQALTIEGEDQFSGNTQAVDITLENAWAIRALSSAAVTLAGEIQNDTLTHESESGSTITVSDLVLTAGSESGDSIELDPKWELQKGDISFKLDLAGADHTGTYQSAATQTDATDTFLLTLTGN